MEVQGKLNDALKDTPAADRRTLETFFAFANRELTQAIRAVRRMNRTLKRIRHDLQR